LIAVISILGVDVVNVIPFGLTECKGKAYGNSLLQAGSSHSRLLCRWHKLSGSCGYNTFPIPAKPVRFSENPECWLLHVAWIVITFHGAKRYARVITGPSEGGHFAFGG
jgi:hypothetical protein